MLQLFASPILAYWRQLQGPVCLLCRFGEAQHWTRDDARGTWNCTKAVLSAVEADVPPKQQASIVCTAGDAHFEADMAEVSSLLPADKWAMSLDAWSAECYARCW